jgi:hypothetical protein
MLSMIVLIRKKRGTEGGPRGRQIVDNSLLNMT